MKYLPPLAQKVAFGTPATQSYIDAIRSGAIIQQHSPMLRKLISVAFFLLMAKLNINVVRNLLSRRQTMNGSFDKLRLVGTYGAFGVVSEEREELIIESANDTNGPWKEYHFKVKPGDVYGRPRWISPYHHRIDWQMWIASASGRVERSPWLFSFLLKLLKQEKDVVGLLESDPWSSEKNLESANGDTNGSSANADNSKGTGPKYIRIEKYRYKFYNHREDDNANVSDDGDDAGKKPYWIRERLGRYFPRQGVVTADMLEEIVNPGQ